MQRPVRHHATLGFWKCYGQLPTEICRLADQCFELLKQNPRHPSLHFKKVGRYWSVRIGLYYRAAGLGTQDVVYGSGLGVMPNMTNSFHDLQHHTGCATTGHYASPVGLINPPD